MLQIFLSLFYFLIVFIGLFIVHNKYTDDRDYFIELSDDNSGIVNRSYIIIEIVVLGIIIMEIIVKLACATR
jgi:uncharacterized protein YxeA